MGTPTLRGWRDDDIAAFVAAGNAVVAADGLPYGWDEPIVREEILGWEGIDPARDILVAELDGERPTAAALLLVAVYDLTQRRHTILRNFPVIGHLRYGLESIGPELRQYIVTDNDSERPFSRDERRWVYEAAGGLESVDVARQAEVHQHEIGFEHAALGD